MSILQSGWCKSKVERVDDSRMSHYKVDLMLSNREIAEKTGLSVRVVGERLRAIGLGEGKGGRVCASAVMSGHRDKELIALVDKKQTGVAIGRLLHCSEFTVRRRLSVLGLKLQSSKNTAKAEPRPPAPAVKPTGFSKGSSLLRSFRYDRILGR
jgi:hypothetical protein